MAVVFNIFGAVTFFMIYVMQNYLLRCMIVHNKISREQQKLVITKRLRTIVLKSDIKYKPKTAVCIGLKPCIVRWDTDDENNPIIL